MLTLVDVFKWLSINGKTHIRFSTRLVLDKLNDAVALNNPTEAWIIMNRLRLISVSSPDEEEFAEVLLECGRVSYEFGYYEDAICFFDLALHKYYSQWHQSAVILWMQGYLYWLIPNQLDRAIICWQKSLDYFLNIKERKLIDCKEPEWYDNQIINMKESILNAINNGHSNSIIPMNNPMQICSNLGT